MHRNRGTGIEYSQPRLPDMGKRVSVLYLVIAQEFGILAELGIARRGLDGYQVATSATERLALHALDFIAIPSNVPLSMWEARYELPLLSSFLS